MFWGLGFKDLLSFSHSREVPWFSGAWHTLKREIGFKFKNVAGFEDKSMPTSLEPFWIFAVLHLSNIGFLTPAVAAKLCKKGVKDQDSTPKSKVSSSIVLHCTDRNKNLYKVQIWHKGQEVWDFAIRDLPCYQEMLFLGGPVLSTPLSAHRKKASTRQHWYCVFSFLHTILQQGLSTRRQIQSELNSTHSHPLHFDQFHADKIGEIVTFCLACSSSFSRCSSCCKPSVSMFCR